MSSYKGYVFSWIGITSQGEDDYAIRQRFDNKILEHVSSASAAFEWIDAKCSQMELPIHRKSFDELLKEIGSMNGNSKEALKEIIDRNFQ